MYRRRQSRRGFLARLRALGLSDLEGYRERLLSDPAEGERLVTALRVTVTRFLRDPPVWRDLAETVLPALLEGLPAGEPLRAWSAGCCGGEEPYTLALLWEGLPPALREGRELEVLATDLDEEVLARGREARYPARALRAFPPALRRAGLEGEGSLLQISAGVRRRVGFARADLLQDPPPRGRRLVLCRYLAFTYYQGERHRRAVEALLAALEPGGALVLGAKEQLPDALHERLEPWPGVACVLRRVLSS
jgi:chemotaxis methyl-accepting protein methylase